MLGRLDWTEGLCFPRGRGQSPGVARFVEQHFVLVVPVLTYTPNKHGYLFHSECRSFTLINDSRAGAVPNCSLLCSVVYDHVPTSPVYKLVLSSTGGKWNVGFCLLHHQVLTRAELVVDLLEESFPQERADMPNSRSTSPSLVKGIDDPHAVRVKGKGALFVWDRM